MLVSVVIPARDWDPLLETTLESIAAQRLPDGVSTETIVGLAGSAPDRIPTCVRAIRNPTGTIPDALNLAIAEASGSVVIRVDSRCNLPLDYVARVIGRLDDPTVGCVGAAQLVLDRGVFGTAYAVAFNSPLLGPSAYRYRASSGPSDTAYLGSWRRADLIELGGFDPRLIRNQDNELADRVRASGRLVWYDAELVVGYYNRRNLRSAMAHHHEFGAWRMVQAGHGQRALTPRHIAALATVAVGGLATAAAVVAPATRRTAMLVLGAGYLGATAAAYRTASRLRRVRPDIAGPGFHPIGVALAPAVAVAIDAAWGAGLIRGLALRGGRSQSGKLDPGVPKVH